MLLGACSCGECRRPRRRLRGPVWPAWPRPRPWQTSWGLVEQVGPPSPLQSCTWPPAAQPACPHRSCGAFSWDGSLNPRLFPRASVQFCAHCCLFLLVAHRRKEKSTAKKIVAEAEPEPEPEHHIESESTTGLWAAFVLGAALLGTAAYLWSKRRR